MHIHNHIHNKVRKKSSFLELVTWSELVVLTTLLLYPFHMTLLSVSTSIGHGSLSGGKTLIFIRDRAGHE